MPEQLLSLLKLCLLALLYLFFARVLWAVWSEVRAARTPAAPVFQGPGGPPPAAPKRARGGKGADLPPNQLVALQPEGLKGRAFHIGSEITIGRANGCGISLPDDTYVSQLHARVHWTDGDVWLEDLHSTNGTYLNGLRLGQPVRLHRGDQVQVGATVLEAS